MSNALIRMLIPVFRISRVYHNLAMYYKNVTGPMAITFVVRWRGTVQEGERFSGLIIMHGEVSDFHRMFVYCHDFGYYPMTVQLLDPPTSQWLPFILLCITTAYKSFKRT